MSPEPALSRRMTVAGVVLAAGSSERMGTNKLLLPLGDRSVIRRAVETAARAGLAPVVVVLGHQAERVAGELTGLCHVAITNGDYARGKHTSLRLGIGAVPPEASAAVVLLGDMPFVTEHMVSAVVTAYRRSDAPLVVSRYGNVTAPPMLYARELFAELLEADEKHCGKAMLRRHRQRAVLVEQPEDALADLDVAADYERARARVTG